MTINADHIAHLRTSGLSDATIAAAGFFSVDDPVLAGQLLGWDSDGPAPALGIPYLDREGQPVMTILRPDQPREKEGRRIKYESPLSSVPRLYFPPASLIASARYLDVAEPLILVEGIKKALKIAEQGATVISAQGTTVWHQVETRKRTGQWKLHEDLAPIPLRGRLVYIAFDGGDTSENLSVIEAEARLGRMCIEAGANVKLLRIPSPSGEKVGIDDYLATMSDPKHALDALFSTSVMANPLDRARFVANAADPATAAMALLQDPAFLTALRIGPHGLLDTVADELGNSAAISKTTIKSALEDLEKKVIVARTSKPKPAGVSPQVSPHRADAEFLLGSADPLRALLDIARAWGLVGEEDGAATLLLVIISRNSRNPIHAALRAATSSGKSHLMKRMTDLAPPEDVIDITSMTPQAMLHLPGDMDGKVITIAEHEGADRALYTMRIAMSERVLQLWVPEKVHDEATGATRMETVLKKISCSSSFVTTTTKARLLEDNETRLIEILMDESTEQTARINSAQLEAAARPISPTQLALNVRRREVAREALRLIPSAEVIIPDQWHARLKSLVNASMIRARRDLPKILQLAAAHARLNHRRRTMQGDMLVAAEEDVEIAATLLRRVQSGGSNLLTKSYELLEAHFGGADFGADEAQKVLGFSDSSNARKRLKTMRKENLVEQVSTNGSKKMWRLVRSGPGPLFSPVVSIPAIPQTTPVPLPMAALPIATPPSHPHVPIPWSMASPSPASPSPASVGIAASRSVNGVALPGPTNGPDDT